MRNKYGKLQTSIKHEIFALGSWNIVKVDIDKEKSQEKIGDDDVIAGGQISIISENRLHIWITQPKIRRNADFWDSRPITSLDIEF